MTEVDNAENLITQVQTISLAKDEVLLVRLQQGLSLQAMRRFEARLKEVLNTDKVLVFSVDDASFLKVKLEEKLIDEIVDREIQK